MSIEQLETLKSAMPTRDEKRLVMDRVTDGIARASALELERLDAALIKAKLGALVPTPPDSKQSVDSNGAKEAPPVSKSAWERFVTEDVVVARSLPGPHKRRDRLFPLGDSVICDQTRQRKHPHIFYPSNEEF